MNAAVAPSTLRCRGRRYLQTHRRWYTRECPHAPDSGGRKSPLAPLGACPSHACTLARSAWGREGMGRRSAAQRLHAPSMDVGIDAHDGTVCRSLLCAIPCGRAQAHAPLSVTCVPVKDGTREAFFTGSSILFRTWEARRRLMAHGPSLLCQLVSCTSAYAPLGEQRQLHTRGTAKSCGGQLEVSVL